MYVRVLVCALVLSIFVEVCLLSYVPVLSVCAQASLSHASPVAAVLCNSLDILGVPRFSGLGIWTPYP